MLIITRLLFQFSAVVIVSAPLQQLCDDDYMAVFVGRFYVTRRRTVADESPLRLCRDLSSDEEAARLKSKQKMGNDQPLCIPANSLKLYTGQSERFQPDIVCMGAK